MRRCCRGLVLASALLGLFVGMQPRVGLAQRALDGHAEAAIPEALAPWAAWVLRSQPGWQCPWTGQGRQCVWPTRLVFAQGTGGLTFRLSLYVDAPSQVALPGSRRHWPQEVTGRAYDARGDWRALRVLALGAGEAERPVIELGAGWWEVRGVFDETEAITSLSLPGEVALITLDLGEGRARALRRASDGTVRLREPPARDGETERPQEALHIAVHRLLRDDVPAQLTTHMRFDVTGAPREVDVGAVLPEGFVLYASESPLPLSWTDDGGLRVSVRAGSHEVLLHAERAAELRTLRRPTPGAHWPESEVWAVDASSGSRLAEVRGAPGVDGRRTSMPVGWRALPAYRMAETTELAFVEISRGMSSPPDDQRTVHRRLWWSPDGTRIEARDHVIATLFRPQRLNVQTPGRLGRVTLGGDERLLTIDPDGASLGVELRHTHVDLHAEVHYDETRGRLPALGWATRADQLSAELMTPPGWTFVAAVGPDRASTSWVERWDLFDLFLLLLLVLVVRAVAGTPAALLGGLGWFLAWHELHLPKVSWLVLLAALAIHIGLAGRVRFPLWWHTLRWSLILAVCFWSLAFFAEQARTAFFPHLAQDVWGPDGYRPRPHGSGLDILGGAREQAPPMARSAATRSMEAMVYEHDEFLLMEDAAEEGAGGAAYGRSGRGMGARQEAPAPDEPARLPELVPAERGEMLQTGWGIPQWRWRAHPLAWSGPVSGSQQLRLILLPPWLTALLSLLRAFLMLALVAWVLLVLQRRVKEREGRSVPVDRPGGGVDAGSEAGVDAGVGSEIAGVVPTEGSGAAAKEDRGAAAQGAVVVGVLLACLVFVAAPAPSAHAASAFPSADMLRDLQAWLTRQPTCAAQCVATEHLRIEAREGRLQLVARVHVGVPSAWVVPGPAAAWVPERVVVEGREMPLVRGSDDRLRVRLPEGVHTLRVEGELRDGLALELAPPPYGMALSAAGWAVDGWRPGQQVPNVLHFRREGRAAENAQEEEQAGVPQADPDAAMLEPGRATVSRTLVFDVTWRVHVQVSRRAPGRRTIAVALPLMPGESLARAPEGVDERDGRVVVTLGPGVSTLTYATTLQEAASVTLQAPAAGASWTETWHVQCTTLWRCRAEGVPPVGAAAQTVAEGESLWSQTFKPWADETLVIGLERAAGAAGPTMTIDSARLMLSTGRRLENAELNLRLRTSTGGGLTLQLPSGVALQGVWIDGRVLPTEHEGGRVQVIVPPGEGDLRVVWQEERAWSLRRAAPTVVLGQGAVDVRVSWAAPESRWLLWAGGSPWGPVVVFWQWALALMVVAWVLARVTPTPLRVSAWFLLALGMTQVTPIAPLVVAAWLVVCGLRPRLVDQRWWIYNLTQVALVGLTLLAFVALFAAIRQGLVLRPPDMQVTGAGSSSGHLQWYVDRSEGSLPVVWIVSLPLWCWHFTMLAWALWLAWRVVGWSRWAWETASAAGLWRKRPPQPPPAQQPPTAWQWPHSAASPPQPDVSGPERRAEAAPEPSRPPTAATSAGGESGTGDPA